MRKIAIIGCGLIGRAWAISFAKGGMSVSLWDSEPTAPPIAINYISDILDELDAYDLLNGASVKEVLARISTADRLDEAVLDADHIQENTPEKVDIKRRIFAELDERAQPGATIASSSSAILPSTFTQELQGRERCMVMHPLNPPYLIPAVEIVPAPWTSDDALAFAKQILGDAGHAPIVMKQELNGFVMNRLQGALLEEAFRLAENNYASPEDIDVALKEGLALRWSFMGPFETIDLNAPNGIRDYVARYNDVYVPIFEQSDWRADWKGAVLDEVEQSRRQSLPASELEARQIWRDKRLIALMAHKNKADEEIGK